MTSITAYFFYLFLLKNFKQQMVAFDELPIANYLYSDHPDITNQLNFDFYKLAMYLSWKVEFSSRS